MPLDHGGRIGPDDGDFCSWRKCSPRGEQQQQYYDADRGFEHRPDQANLGRRSKRGTGFDHDFRFLMISSPGNLDGVGRRPRI